MTVELSMIFWSKSNVKATYQVGICSFIRIDFQKLIEVLSTMF